MKLYHGSNHVIETPIYHGGKRNNDYGFGFYCTEYEDMAREWGSSANGYGYVNAYTLNTRSLSILNLHEYPTIVWLTILLENRLFALESPLAKEAYAYLAKEFHIDYEDYDLIIGYRADDSYFSFAQDFINGSISYRQLGEAMHLGKLGDQVVLKSKKAFDRIRFVGAEEVDCRIWYPKRMARDENARKDYHATDKRYVRGDLYITRILDEEMKRDDVRLQ